MDCPWIASVFLLLHSLVFIMKQHSYAFYNGHLWHTLGNLKTVNGLIKKSESTNTELEDLRDFLNDELNAQSSPTVKFPENLTFRNFFEYSMFPTLVYQINFPRTNSIDWSYVAVKISAVFGVFSLMIVLAEVHLLPSVLLALEIRDYPFYEKIQAYPVLLIEFILPFVLMILLVFYIIWDAILNAIAELTMFADREFYGPWWNTVTWDEFARDWNVPVHRFLLRHVYHSSISSFNVSKKTATVITFLLSSCVHELVMFIIFNKLRGYLLFLQMGQIPLVALSRSKFLKNKKLLGNVIFWFGMVIAPSLVCTLYLTF